jgi:GNAT superfamily N-acetyltransferase
VSSGDKINITGYFPGVIGSITTLHARYYHDHWGFDRSFEIQVGSELCEFIRGFDPSRDGFWAARKGGEFAGAVALDGSLAETEGARIRWFIVDPRCHGTGIGRDLLNQAMNFCRQKAYAKVYLWTFKGLDTARALYERHGFELTLEETVSQWGAVIHEQKFELIL